MRIVIDLQGAQTSGSRHRGIGRYSLWLAQAMVRNRGEHEIIIALSDHFPDTIEPIRADFEGLLPPSNIRVWRALSGVSALAPDNRDRRQAAELIRESFLASLKPDFVLVTSLFEGLGDDAITSIRTSSSEVPVATVLYDLIPHIHRSTYLPSLAVRSWYDSKLDSLRRTSLALAISDSSRREGVEYLGFTAENCINISTATDPRFREQPIGADEEQLLRRRLGLDRPFVMYTGGIDHRKNIEGLVRAFARLPSALRLQYQLAVVCSIHAPDRVRLATLAAEHGLNPDELILTGYVSDDDLLALYNLCTLFVFPSWHEGFGLPALEAMSCGRAVIAAGTSSLPEVVGREDALFDPHDDGAMSALIERVLTDADFRADLEQHGRVQSKCFSWDRSALRAIEAMEGWLAREQQTRGARRLGDSRPRMAYLSPLPPERSGISDYSADLLPELSRHYRIDVIVAQSEVHSDWVHANCEIRGVEWFRKHAKDYDRVLYHFGNSHFHAHMFALLREIPGVVVLHDFFLSGITAYLDLTGMQPGYWTQQLQASVGYKAAKERYTTADLEDLRVRYPVNLEVLQLATGLIVHSPASARMGRDWYGEGAVTDWHVIPLLRNLAVLPDRTAARRRLGFDADTTVVCSFGLLAGTKMCLELHSAWLQSTLSDRSDCVLVFVGDGADTEFGRSLAAAIQQAPNTARVVMTGWIDNATYRDYLAATDIAVQLRRTSRGETSAAVLDCMGSGLPTIVNANGSMADLPDSAVWMLPDAFEAADLVDALDQLAGQPALRRQLGSAARAFVSTEHHPRACADRYRDVIEDIYRADHRIGSGQYRALGQCASGLQMDECVRVARAVSLNQPPRPRPRKLFIDVTCLIDREFGPDLRTSIEGLLGHWLDHPPTGLQVEPVFLDQGQPYYRYARRYAMELMGCPAEALEDDVVEFAPHDVFLCMGPSLRRACPREWLGAAGRAGVDVRFLLSDFLPVHRPDQFPEGAGVNMRDWLMGAAESNGILCPSRALAEAALEWLQCFGPDRARPLPIDVVALEAESVQAPAAPAAAGGHTRLLDHLSKAPSFLVLGDVEPRKHHQQILAAFEQLWKEGVDVNLVIAGEPGWQAEATIDDIQSSVELGRHLFWLERPRMPLLEAVLARVHCLIAAQADEGFDLALVRASQRGLHVLARDIPALHEAAGHAASFFKGDHAADLAAAVRKWLLTHSSSPRSVSAPASPRSWRDAARGLEATLMADQHAFLWKRDGGFRYWGNDPRLSAQVGRRLGRCVQSAGEAGFLMFGPYLALPTGRYRITLFGSAAPSPDGIGYMDVAVRKGAMKLVELPIRATVPANGPGESTLVEAEVELDQPCDDLEVRLWAAAHADMVLRGMEIKPLN